jgi:hypothetical protein
MRRREAEQIGEKAVQQCAARVGAGDAASMGLKSCPPTRVDGQGREPEVWCGARAPCLARTASGRLRAPPDWYYDRSAGSLLDWDWAPMPSSQEARPGAEPEGPFGALARATSGAPRGERVDRTTRPRLNSVDVAPIARRDGCAFRRSAPLAWEQEERALPAPENPTSRAAKHCVEALLQAERAFDKTVPKPCAPASFPDSRKISAPDATPRG